MTRVGVAALTLLSAPATDALAADPAPVRPVPAPPSPAASPSPSPAALPDFDNWLKTQTVVMPTIEIDEASGEAEMTEEGGFVTPEGPEAPDPKGPRAPAGRPSTDRPSRVSPNGG